MHERQAIKKRVKSLLEGIWLSFYCYPATTGYLFLIISDQQFIDRFSFLGYGTDGTEDADSLDMETGIEVVEEGVLRVLLPGIGVGKHSFGTGGRVKLLEEELIRFNHKLLQDVVILDGDYRQTAEYTGANSLFYFDPPYKPVNEGNSCTSYMPQDFGDEEQINLANFCKGIGETGAK